MLSANIIPDCQNADRLTQHPAIRPERGAAVRRSPDRTAGFNRVDTAEQSFADIELGTIPVVDHFRYGSSNRADQSTLWWRGL